MQVADFSSQLSHSGAIGPSLRPIGESTDDTGFDTIWVIDHFSLLLSDSITWFPTG